MEDEMIKLDDLMLHYATASAPRRRREGFPGQRLVVLPEPLLGRMAGDPILEDLFATAAGFFPRAPGHLVRRAGGISEFVLIKVLSGTGWIQLEERHDIPADSFVLLPAGTPHSYGATDTDPWSIQWVHFRGRSAAAFAELFRTSPQGKPFSLHPAQSSQLDLSLLYDALEAGYSRMNLLVTASHLRMLLTELHKQRHSHQPLGTLQAVEQTLDWMRANLDQRCTLDALARRSRLSVPYYSALFKRITGFSPMEYFIRLKIQRACQLLDTTNFRVGEVAAALGWEDAFYFTRIFRKITGKSPRAYRQMMKG